MIKSFLNKIIKENGFLLETSDKKIHTIGDPVKEKPIKLKFHSKFAEIKCALFPDYYFGKLFFFNAKKLFQKYFYTQFPVVFKI